MVEGEKILLLMFLTKREWIGNLPDFIAGGTVTRIIMRHTVTLDMDGSIEEVWKVYMPVSGIGK